MEVGCDQVEVLAETLRGKAVISVRKEVWQHGEEELKWALVMKLSKTQMGRSAGLATVLKRAWKLEKEVKFMEVSKEVIIARFEREYQMDKAWEEGPWSYMGDMILMQRWVPGCKPSTMPFDRLQIWMQIHRLPIELMKEEVAMGVAAVAGRVYNTGQHDSEIFKARFYRVKVKIDVNQPLVTGCFLERCNKTHRWLSFKYERLPRYCFGCGRMGHDRGRCAFENESGKFGMGLRADSHSMLGPDGEKIADGDDGVVCTELVVHGGGLVEEPRREEAGDLGDHHHDEHSATRVEEGTTRVMNNSAGMVQCEPHDISVMSVAECRPVAAKMSEPRSEKETVDKGKGIVGNQRVTGGERKTKKFRAQPILLGPTQPESLTDGPVKGVMFYGPKKRNLESQIVQETPVHIVKGTSAVVDKGSKKRHREGANLEETVKNCKEHDSVEDMEMDLGITLNELISAEVAKRPRREQ